MTPDTTFHRLARLVADMHGVRVAQVTPATRLAEITGGDETEQAWLYTEIEKEFRVDLPENQLELAGTFGELADVVRRALVLKVQRAA